MMQTNTIEKAQLLCDIVNVLHESSMCSFRELVFIGTSRVGNGPPVTDSFITVASFNAGSRYPLDILSYVYWRSLQVKVKP
jgi:hypothetical protein